MKPTESIPDNLKKLSILKIYNELKGSQETRFNRLFTEQPELQRYTNDLQQKLRNLPHLEEPIPSTDLIKTQRHALTQATTESSHKSSYNAFIESFSDPISIQKYKKIGLRVALAIGIILILSIAAFLIINRDAPIESLVSKSTEYKIRSQIENENLDPAHIKYAKSQRGEVSFVIESDQTLTYAADYGDQLVRDLICYLLINSKNPGKRLQSVKHLKEINPDVKIKGALITTLLSDPNQGIRLKAIRILNTYPADDTINQACMKVLLEDQNNTVRMEALNILSEKPGENILPILQVVSRLDENEFIRNKATQIMEEIIESS
jgi:hypothetical protein